jgi:hypothetical protein
MTPISNPSDPVHNDFEKKIYDGNALQQGGTTGDLMMAQLPSI